MRNVVATLAFNWALIIMTDLPPLQSTFAAFLLFAGARFVAVDANR